MGWLSLRCLVQASAWPCIVGSDFAVAKVASCLMKQIGIMVPSSCFWHFGATIPQECNLLQLSHPRNRESFSSFISTPCYFLVRDPRRHQCQHGFRGGLVRSDSSLARYRPVTYTLSRSLREVLANFFCSKTAPLVPHHNTYSPEQVANIATRKLLLYNIINEKARPCEMWITRCPGRLFFS